MSQCPIAAAFGNIRGGGYYDDNCNENGNNVVVMGGDEYVYDAANYYIMQKTIERARAAAKGTTMSLPTGTYAENRDRIMAIMNLPTGDYILRLGEMITSMENLIMRKCSARCGNISLPSAYSGVSDPSSANFVDCDGLCDSVNAIAKYMNKLNVNSLLHAPVHVNLPKFGRLEAILPTPNKVMTTFDEEITVAKHCAEIEKYHCAAIRHLAPAVDGLQKIIDDLSGGNGSSGA